MSRALSQGTSRMRSAVPSSRGDFRASVQWITMPSVLQITNAPFTHLTNPLPARRRSTLARLCPFTLVLHAAIVENASRRPPRKFPIQSESIRLSGSSHALIHPAKKVQADLCPHPASPSHSYGIAAAATTNRDHGHNSPTIQL